uniref:OTU domain-containing protein n=1 Tax=Timspurckia oligopyrenoides TaxID=708627 RepID=A0A7S1ES55_9RHOD
MGVSEDSEDESLSELERRHDEERVALKARGDRLRASIPKKQRVERARLETELSELFEQLMNTQSEERSKRGLNPNEVVEISSKCASKDNEESNMNVSSKSKGQRRKEKKLQRETEQQKMIEEEKNRLSLIRTDKDEEEEKFASILKQNQLKIHPIPPDGHCLYAAVAHQLSLCRDSTELSSTKRVLRGVLNEIKECKSVEKSVRVVRAAAADGLESLPEQYAPFADCENGENFQGYCDRVRNQSDWGGELELRALAEFLGIQIQIFSAQFPVVTMGSESSALTIRLSFHRHQYSLGEHYNSLVSSI